MLKNIKTGFTFVELIVVVTIMAILASIWFTVYQEYLSSSRDSNRIVQLNDIHDGLELLSASSRLPFPENMIEITANGSFFAYQWDAWEWVINAIWYDGWGTDPEYDIPFVYMLSKNSRDFQLLGFIVDPAYLSFSSLSYANNIEYSELFPKVVWKALWVTVQRETQTPLHLASDLIENGGYDVVTGTWETVSYISDTESLDSLEGENILSLVPNQSCARILDLWKSKWNGRYVISPDGVSNKQVYCDMETDGGWWTYIGHIDNTAHVSELSFSWAYWSYSSVLRDSDTTDFLDSSNIDHTEMMVTINWFSPSEAQENGNLRMFKYWSDADMFHSTDVLSCSSKFWLSDGLFYKSNIDDEYAWTTVASGCSWSEWAVRPIDLSGWIIRLRSTWWPGAGSWLNDGSSWWNSGWVFVR